MKKLISKWYLVIVVGFMLFAALVFGICGEDSILAVHDNLDLFIPQFQMMKNTGTFWGQDVTVPFLGGISRDTLPSEFSLYTFLYMILPSYWAYIAGYLLKIVIALFSCILLAKDFCKENYETYRPLVYLVGLSYGILNVFPTFGIPFASIPLVIYLLRKIYAKPSFGWYMALFFYPLVSYFSYFGLFILAYMVVAFLWLWIRDKKFPLRILTAIVVLSAGFIACEYRLFATMLLDDTETIRSTMEAGSLTAGEIVKTIGEVFAKGMFHAESIHTYLVMPVCLIYFVYLNAGYIRQKNTKAIFCDVYNLLMLVLVFNSVVYGIYYWEGFRGIIETVCPPLTGWQFNRTVFFSPFVWYAAFFLVLKRLYDSEKKAAVGGANVLAVAAVLLIVLSGTRYNDLYHTCYGQALSILKDKEPDALSYREFYSEELFEIAKEDIDYCGQWSMAYGFYPATLEYNDIRTLDGYLGFYSQSYKEAFRKVIAPALERVPESKEYYDTWGARAYLYSGTDLSIVSGSRTYNVTDRDIYIDIDAFKELGGRYIFSRIELTNAAEAGLELIGTYTHEDSPYTLYVYQTISRYPSKERANISFEEMKALTYDGALLEEQILELEELAAAAVESGEAEKPERVKELYLSVEQELTKMSTCNSIADIVYYQDVYNEESADRKEEILEDIIELQDGAYVALREICSSPYQEAMKEVMDPALVEAFAEYEELTEREKEITLLENSLVSEYDQAAGEDYTIEYNGEEWDFERFYGADGETLSQQEYIEVYQALNREKNSVLGEIFLELVDLRTEEAKLKGYDNYAEYAYSELYIRDYDLEDAEKLFEEVKDDVVPALQDLQAAAYEKDFSGLYDNAYAQSGEEIFGTFGEYLDDIDPELKESLDHMLEYRMYDMDAAEGKAAVGFTIDLMSYGDAFIFMDPYQCYLDYSQSIHEFGHYNQAYRSTENIMEQQNNLDLCEIHSQGLEMLFYEYYEEMLGEELGEQFGFFQVYNMSTGIIDIALLSEFEIEAYKHPEMSLEDLNKLYLNLSEQYGIYYVDGIDELYTWSDVSHVFSSPCYYISYMTSAFSSLDLLTLAEEDRHKAVETYMELTTLPTYAPYCEAVEYVGLRDIFEKGVPEEIAEETVKILGIE
ncbi:MAG: hypothetical protein IJ409_07410 [Lachnospiraceae bacterium]|nr:hypothetical protein [Lachnospiraceae bacterium]